MFLAYSRIFDAVHLLSFLNFQMKILTGARALEAEPADIKWTRKKWNLKNFVDLHLLPQYEWSSLAEKFD